jgi:hypothetical protein
MNDKAALVTGATAVTGYKDLKPLAGFLGRTADAARTATERLAAS